MSNRARDNEWWMISYRGSPTTWRTSCHATATRRIWTRGGVSAANTCNKLNTRPQISQWRQDTYQCPDTHARAGGTDDGARRMRTSTTTDPENTSSGADDEPQPHQREDTTKTSNYTDTLVTLTELKPSTIPRTGRGLFLTRDVKK